jgi:hypothetical protein
LFYVAEKKIMALYPTLDVYSRQVVVVQACSGLVGLDLMQDLLSLPAPLPQLR